MMFPVTMLYTSLLGLLMIILSIGVSRNRLKTRVSIGSGGDASLENAIRAHGNFCEYVPLALLLLLMAESVVTQTWLLHVFGLTFFLARVSHAWGMTRPVNVNLGRRLGAGLTLLMIISISLYNLGYVLGSII